MHSYLSHFWCETSPSSADSALLSVEGVVDGQVTVQVTRLMPSSSGFASSECTSKDFSAVRHQATSQLQSIRPPSVVLLQSALVPTSLLQSISLPVSSSPADLIAENK